MEIHEFQGHWRISRADRWSQEALDERRPAMIEVTVRDRRGHGSLAVLGIEADLDVRFSRNEGAPRMSFSWAGRDNRGWKFGRGFARLTSPTVMRGKIFVHAGQELRFTATRILEKPAPGST